MRRDVLLVREPQIRGALDMPSCIDVVAEALAAYSGGRAEVPSIIHLDIPEHDGEIHVKAGYLHGQPIYACKFASGFPGNVELGLPPNDGMVIVFDATTGAPAAFLFDNGLITDVRTGAAGGVAVRHLAPAEVSTVAVIGTGAQALQQLRALLCERPDVGQVNLWGRSTERTAARAVELMAELRSGGAGEVAVSAVDSVEAAVADATVIISVTPSREALVQRAWVAKGCTLIAVGSDGPGKQELDPQLLGDADLVVVDSREQCAERGELQHALAAGLIAVASSTVELGEIVGGNAKGRSSDDQLIVCDLTGVGVQDVAAAALILEKTKGSAAKLAI